MKTKTKPGPPPHKARPARVPFPRKNHPPTLAEFAARLPLALGRRFESVRAFLRKTKGVTEDLYFYGPKSGWALRYLGGGRPLCALFVLQDRPLGILSIDEPLNSAIDWKAMSPVAQAARKGAHGTPALLWLDVPLDGSGATDFKAIIKAKLGASKIRP